MSNHFFSANFYVYIYMFMALTTSQLVDIRDSEKNVGIFPFHLSYVMTKNQSLQLRP